MAARGLTDIYARSRGHAAPEGEYRYISKTLSTSMQEFIINKSLTLIYYELLVHVTTSM